MVRAPRAYSRCGRAAPPFSAQQLCGPPEAAPGVRPGQVGWAVAASLPTSRAVPGAGPFEEGTAQLTTLLLATDTFTDLVRGIAELSVRMVEQATACGITLFQHGRVVTVAASVARDLHEQQYERDAGRAWRRCGPDGSCSPRTSRRSTGGATTRVSYSGTGSGRCSAPR